jgi:hypothetical protein
MARRLTPLTLLLLLPACGSVKNDLKDTTWKLTKAKCGSTEHDLTTTSDYALTIAFGDEKATLTRNIDRLLLSSQKGCTVAQPKAITYDDDKLTITVNGNNTCSPASCVASVAASVTKAYGCDAESNTPSETVTAKIDGNTLTLTGSDTSNVGSSYDPCSAIGSSDTTSPAVLTFSKQ